MSLCVAGQFFIFELNKKINEEASKDAKADASAAAKRAELDLELAINEAKASGNDKLATKLKWQKDYNDLLAKRLEVNDPDAYGKAIRGANAEEAGPIEKAKNSVHLSSLALAGHSVGESAQAATIQPQLAKLDLIHQSATRTALAVERTHRMLETIANKSVGYQ